METLPDWINRVTSPDGTQVKYFLTEKTTYGEDATDKVRRWIKVPVHNMTDWHVEEAVKIDRI